MKEYVTGWYIVDDQKNEPEPEIVKHKTPQEAIEDHNSRMWEFINGDKEKKENIINLREYFIGEVCDVRCVMEKGLPNRVCFLIMRDTGNETIPKVNNEMITAAAEKKMGKTS